MQTPIIPDGAPIGRHPIEGVLGGE
ncbi:MAG: hypothetical protein RLZZ378_966, partial [Actinomycetota bacterium]